MTKRLTPLLLVGFLLFLGGCASADPGSAARRQRELYADIQKEMQAYEIRRQMDHNIREAEDSLRMPGGMSAVPDFR